MVYNIFFCINLNKNYIKQLDFDRNTESKQVFFQCLNWWNLVAGGQAAWNFLEVVPHALGRAVSRGSGAPWLGLNCAP